MSWFMGPPCGRKQYRSHKHNRVRLKRFSIDAAIFRLQSTEILMWSHCADEICIPCNRIKTHTHRVHNILKRGFAPEFSSCRTQWRDLNKRAKWVDFDSFSHNSQKDLEEKKKTSSFYFTQIKKHKLQKLFHHKSHSGMNHQEKYKL